MYTELLSPKMFKTVYLNYFRILNCIVHSSNLILPLFMSFNNKL